MANEPTPASGATEGGGAYNRHAKLQAGGGAFALVHWENAVRSIVLDRRDEPVVIADYGCSQGKNSLASMGIAIEILRSRVGPDRPIVVCHTDLPTNDYNTLFKLLETDPDRYSRDDANVFPCAVGRSFYHNVLPPDHVHLGWSSYAAMWINRIPTVLPDHIYFPCMTGAARAAFERQGAQDWENFLSLRARELRSGGRLVVAIPGANEEGWCGFEHVMDHANATLTNMVGDGAITAVERARMVVGAWPRRRRDLVAPFARDGRFCGVTVEHCDTHTFPDAAWVDYQRDGNREVFVNKQVGFFRSTFAPSLAASLVRANDAEACRDFGDRLEHGLKQRLMREPAPINSLVETIVLAKLNFT
jgi:hypothetical protein